MKWFGIVKDSQIIALLIHRLCWEEASMDGIIEGST